MPHTHDPASYLLSEISAYDAGLRSNWEPWQRAHYLDVVLVEEAKAFAWGRHHLSMGTSTFRDTPGGNGQSA